MCFFQFSINYSEQEISLIKQKVKEYPWARMSNNDGWELGTNKNYLKEIFSMIRKKKYNHYYKQMLVHLSEAHLYAPLQ